jgi:hypothetical protein
MSSIESWLPSKTTGFKVSGMAVGFGGMGHSALHRRKVISIDIVLFDASFELNGQERLSYSMKLPAFHGQ